MFSITAVIIPAQQIMEVICFNKTGKCTHGVNNSTRSRDPKAKCIFLLKPSILYTLLQAILNPSHHLLNVLLQLANKLGLKNNSPSIFRNQQLLLEQ
jgi:hypothetical protein